MRDSISYERKRSEDPKRIAWKTAYRNRPDVIQHEREMRQYHQKRTKSTEEWKVYEQRFWSKAIADGSCLIWMANRNHRGYGMVGQFGKMRIAHRVAWELANNRKIPTGMSVCHHCDNPPCVKPAHLFLGTAKDNSRDMFQKGRANPPVGDRNGSRLHPERVPKGEENANSKLTANDVRRIRRLYVPRGRYSARQLAREYGVHHDTVEKVIHRENWAWLDG